MMELRLLLALITQLLLVGWSSGAYEDAFRHPNVHQFHHGAFQEVSDSIRYDVHRFLHSRAQVPFEVPLELNVVLVGFNGDGGYRFNLDAEAFKLVLNHTIPRHRPACLQTNQRLDIEHKMYYNVLSSGQIELLTLEQAFREAMTEAGTATQTEFGRPLPLYEIEATKLEPILDMFYKYTFGTEADSPSNMNAQMPVAVFILNFDKERMSPLNRNETTNETFSTDIKELSQEQLRDQEAGYMYRYRYNGGPSSQVWLSSRRYMVIDIAAGPSSYGKVDSEEGSVGYKSLPRLQNLHYSPARSSSKLSPEVFTGQLAALVASGVEHVISPDLRYETVDPTQRLLVPIIVLRNHLQYSLIHSGGNDTIDLHAIEKEVKKLVHPGQEVVIVGGTYNLHDHEKLAIALRKALRSLSTHETTKEGRYQARIKPYIDGAILREEFKLSADVLASGLLDIAEPSLSSKYFRFTDFDEQDDDHTRDPVIKSSSRGGMQYGSREDEEKKRLEARLQKPPVVRKSYGTRVVPVFVLSLAGMDKEILMQGESPLWTSNDVVFVVEHASPAFNLSYVSENTRLKAVPGSPQRHIIAGLASVVGGLAAPFERASPVHQRRVVNWLWACGHHPFGPFSTTAGISQLMIDTALRNLIYGRVDKALRTVRESTEMIQNFTGQYLKTHLGEPVKGEKPKSAPELWIDKLYKKTTNLPMPIPHDVVDQLEKYLDELEKQLVEVSALLFDHRLEEAYQNSTNVLYYSTFAKSYVEHSVETEREKLRCCKVEYKRPVRTSQAFIYGGILVAGFVIYFLVIAFSSLSSDKW